MNRRAFVACFGVLAAPLAIEAQQVRVYLRASSPLHSNS